MPQCDKSHCVSTDSSSAGGADDDDLNTTEEAEDTSSSGAERNPEPELNGAAASRGQHSPLTATTLTAALELDTYSFFPICRGGFEQSF